MLLGAVVLNACKKDTTSSKGLLTMKVNGTTWTADNEVGAFISTANKLVVDGNFNGEVVTIGVTNVPGVGTFDMKTSGSLFSYDVAGNQDYLIASYVTKSHGTATITQMKSSNSVGTGVIGTFEGVAYNGNGDSVVITNGKFEDKN